jgi:hypothetical protein
MTESQYVSFGVCALLRSLVSPTVVCIDVATQHAQRHERIASSIGASETKSSDTFIACKAVY